MCSFHQFVAFGNPNSFGPYTKLGVYTSHLLQKGPKGQRKNYVNHFHTINPFFEMNMKFKENLHKKQRFTLLSRIINNLTNVLKMLHITMHREGLMVR